MNSKKHRYRYEEDEEDLIHKKKRHKIERGEPRSKLSRRRKRDDGGAVGAPFGNIVTRQQFDPTEERDDAKNIFKPDMPMRTAKVPNTEADKNMPVYENMGTANPNRKRWT